MSEIGMIPPVARRKLMMRERKKKFENRRNICFLFLLVTFASLFGFSNMQFNNIKSVEDDGKIRLEPPSTFTKLRRGRSWVTQDSQPFVRHPTVTFGIHLISNVFLHFLILSYCCR
jgi:hypothetical protein